MEQISLLKKGVMTVALAVAGTVVPMAALWAGPAVNHTHRRVKARLDVDFKLIGTLAQRTTAEIGKTGFMIGCETLDRGYTDFEAYKEYLPQLGIRKIRLQAGWARCEKEKGRFDFAWLDKIVDWSVANGLDPYLCCVFGNPLYADEKSKGLFSRIPAEGEGHEAWRRWIHELAGHYAGRVRHFETWNEPNNVKGNTPEIIAANNIETAEIIRSHIPDAHVTGIVLGHRAEMHSIMEAIASHGKAGLFNAYSVHLYDANPESSVVWVDQTLNDMATLAPGVKLIDGESGAPGEMIPKFGFSGWPFTEISQAKLDMRRMLVDHSRGVDSSVFAISDMHYDGVEGTFKNAKGLLRANERREIIQVKKAFYAVQNVVNVFDGTREIVPAEKSTFRNLDTTVWFDEYRSTSGDLPPLVVFWQWQTRELKNAPDSLKRERICNCPIPSDSCTTRTFTFDRKGAPFREPVWVDLFTGGVYEFPDENQIVHSTGVTYVNVPVYDSPAILADRCSLPVLPLK